YQFERQLNQLFGRFRENPAWGPKLLLGRKTWIHTVAHAGLSATKVPDRQEIRSAPCVDALRVACDCRKNERFQARRGQVMPDQVRI
ncbi:hypothetical protein, partial [Stenotrophomonas pavanii]|uniref:hypothetical protein n=1 Tax=Stenotrophomonas pavanii TaxID=487698 RepID=UPI002E78B0B1